MKSKKWFISLGLAVVLVVAFALPACTPADGQARVLNIGFPDESNLNMDTNMLMATEVGCLYSMICYETMSTYARVGEEGTEDPYVFKPGLITDYEVLEDQERYCETRGANVTVQVWRLSVREGVKWHDFNTSGNYVTAEDIKWTLENHASEWDYDKPVKWKLYFEGYGAGNISAWEYLEWWIEVVDEHTIDFIHDTPIITSTFPSWWCWEPIVPKHKFEGEEYPQEHHGDHIGSGAFKFVEQEIGSYLRLERNDDWWGWDENGGEYEGEVEELFFNNRADTGAWLMAMTAGDDDWIQSPPPAALDDLYADPDIQVYIAEGIGVYYLGFNHFVQPEVIEPWVGKGYRDYDLDEDDEPVWGYGGPYLDPEKNVLHDKVLREAIAYAINVTAIIDLVNLGYGELANSWVYTDSPAYNDELEWYLCDDEQAEQMLLDAGYYKDGEGWWVSNYTDERIELTLTSDTTAIFLAWSQMVWEQLREFGLDVTLTTIDPSAMTSKLFDPVGGGLELFISGDHPANDPYSRWIWWYGLDQWFGEWNPTYWYNSTFEELFPQLFWRGEEIYDDVIKDIQEVFHGDVPMYMMMRPNSIVAYRTDKWEGWYEQMGGVVLWNNPFSLLDVKWVGPE